MSETPQPPRKPGRPRTRPDNPVGIRCEFSPEEHAEVTEAADAAGLPLVAFVREAALKVARARPKRKEKSK